MLCEEKDRLLDACVTATDRQAEAAMALSAIAADCRRHDSTDWFQRQQRVFCRRKLNPISGIKEMRATWLAFSH